ncbi:cryptochrome/photolyase family protein [Sphingomonas sp.]|uniref:cryptochrome/photolyase family protein n=1 Tax=Sphingomonas sp. TaxID=28214 RepID=UPI003AFFBD49
MSDPVLLWFRQDLRLADQPALAAAVREGPTIPVYVLDDETPGERRMGGASRWWLHHSLAALDADLRGIGSRLILRRGRAADVLRALAEETGAARVHAIRHYEPWWIEAEKGLAKSVEVVLHDGNQLAPLDEIVTGSGKPFRIFTPFWRALSQRMPPDDPLPRPEAIPAPATWPGSEPLSSWALLPTKPDWATGFGEWQPGEAGAEVRLDAFRDHAEDYAEQHNLPATEGTSRLSPHLHFGEISARRVWHGVADAGGSVSAFLREVAWRDFTRNIVAQFPDYATRNARAAFDRMPWRSGAEADADLRAWQRGRTGYPIVDAGMRQLWTSGWMHNRLRLITASFLIKHLLIDWREGERWFWDCLVCADQANNSVNWQWSAGSGVDSNLFPRIMAPLSQSEKFDAAAYIREWVPELSDLPDAAIHDPDEAGRRPGAYPAKIIGHREARERALAAYGRTKE